MLTLVIYDISDNLERNHLIQALQHYGLHRIQKSAFLGNLNNFKRAELEEKVTEHLSGPKNSIYIVPICDKCRELTTIVSEEDIMLEDAKNYQIL
ncbi:MAG: CRISPR-associated endonuclease Cas2 [Methanobacteriales archaeon Met13]